MKKHLNNPYVSGALAVVAVVVVILSLKDQGISIGTSYQETSYHEEDDSFLEEPSALQTAGSTIVATDIEALAAQSSVRDIFEREREISLEPLIEIKPEIATGSLKVKGVWIQGSMRYTVVDDRVLVPGQRYDRVVIDRIEPTGVWVNKDSKSHFVRTGEVWTYDYLKSAANTSN